jgi:2-polyprenyl-3-methyl-5-hydroxy-6-metoxy-1,4-benzoquinol methylase
MLNWIKKIFASLQTKPQDTVSNGFEEFNRSNPLGGNGERVDITYTNKLEFDNLDLYQKSHYKRYEFALGEIADEEICGDFACGTGYGSIMIAGKASKVVGMDINQTVISKIKERYQKVTQVSFVADNLLKLNYSSYFDTIVSFETIEHFSETNIDLLLAKFHSALKPNGRLIFSTPYMQERSEAAEKMGFHLTFYFDETKVTNILVKNGFKPVLFKYQNYDTHYILDHLEQKDFIICVAQRETR